MSYRPFPSFSEWASIEIDDAVYRRYVDLLGKTRADTTPAAMLAAVQRVTKFAAIDTGAIEGLYEVDRGFTRTVATEAAAWEALATTRGEQVKNAIYDALDAYELVLDLATRSERLTEVSIRGLHEVICRSQDVYAVHTAAGRQDHPLPRGQYKRFPNNPTNLRTGRVHEYAPPVDTPAEMHRLVRELSSVEFEAAHPVLQAAYAHYAFVCVHPFADGNGRVARALASAYLYRSPGVPLLIFADQKDAYIDVLESADAGEPTWFAEFILGRVLDVIDLIRSFLRAPGGQLAAASDMLRPVQREGLSHDEMDALSDRLTGLIRDECQRQLAAVDLAGFGYAVRPSEDRIPRPPGYRDGSAALEIVISASPRAEMSERTLIQVFPAWAMHAGPDLVAMRRPGREEMLEVAVRELSPGVTRVLELKVSAWSEGATADVVLRMVERLREIGYLE